MTRIFHLLSLSMLIQAMPSNSAEVSIQLPEETGFFKTATGSQFANGQCLVCHSVEYISTQPLMPRPFWAASVKKMQEKYGANIPAEQIDPLTDYLAINYGVATNAPSAVEAAKQVPLTGSSADPQKIALNYGCLSCHNVTPKIGPAYRDVAEKYKSDSEAAAKIEEQIHKGGSGKWGPIIMPPFPQVSSADIKVLTDWILNQK